MLYSIVTKEIQIKAMIRYYYTPIWASLVAQMVKRLPAMHETQVRSLGREDPMEEEMSTHSSTLAWKISKD